MSFFKDKQFQLGDKVKLYSNIETKNIKGVCSIGFIDHIDDNTGMISISQNSDGSGFGRGSDELELFELITKFSDKEIYKPELLDKGDIFINSEGTAFTVCEVRIPVREKGESLFNKKILYGFDSEIKNRPYGCQTNIIMKNQDGKEIHHFSDFTIGCKIISRDDNKVIGIIKDCRIQIKKGLESPSSYLLKDGTVSKDYDPEMSYLTAEDLISLTSGDKYLLIHPKQYICLNNKLYPKNELYKVIEQGFENYDFLKEQKFDKNDTKNITIIYL